MGLLLVRLDGLGQRPLPPLQVRPQLAGVSDQFDATAQLLRLGIDIDPDVGDLPHREAQQGDLGAHRQPFE